jgi:hypothetical protein
VGIDTFNPPSTSIPEPEHVHPFQQSSAEVISGSLRFRVNGEEHSVGPGEFISIPANTPHHFWNDGAEEAHSIQEFRPALKTDQFFEAFFGLAQDGKLNEKGLPPLLQLAVMVPHFGDEIRLTSAPWGLQKAFFGALAPVGRLLGYRAEYPYPYSDAQGSAGSVDERPSTTRRLPATMTRRTVAGTFVAAFLMLFLLRRRNRSKKR